MTITEINELLEHSKNIHKIISQRDDLTLDELCICILQVDSELLATVHKSLDRGWFRNLLDVLMLK